MNIGTLTATLGVDTKGLNSAVSAVQSASNSMSHAIHAVEAALAALGIAFSVGMVKDYIVGVTHMAGRYEELGIAMRVAGENAGYSGGQVDQFQKSIEKMGIAGIEARNSLLRMSVAGIDLSKSMQLARAAQDVAVVGAINSSEAFERLIYGIQSGQTEVLRTIGLNINFQDSYEKLAASVGKTSKELTEQEKVQVRTNVVLQAAIRYQGLYEKAMTSAEKQQRSLQRYIDNFKVALGEAFQPAYLTIIESMTNAYRRWTEIASMPEVQRGLKDAAQAVLDVFEAVMKLVTGSGDLSKVGENINTMVHSVEAALKIIAYAGAAVLTSFEGLRLVSLEIEKTWINIRTAVDGAMTFLMMTAPGFATMMSKVTGKSVSELLKTYTDDFDAMRLKAAEVQTTIEKIGLAPTAWESVHAMFEELDKTWAVTEKERLALNQMNVEMRKGGDVYGDNYDWVQDIAPEMYKAADGVEKTGQNLTYMLDGVEKVVGEAENSLSTFNQISETSKETSKTYKDQQEEIDKLNLKLTETVRLLKQAKAEAQGLTPASTGVKSYNPTVASEQSGGFLPGFPDGGIMGGYTSRDRYLAAFRGGEAFIPPERVDQYGKGFIQDIISGALPKQATQRVVLDLRVGDGSYPLVVDKTDVFGALIKELKRQELVAGGQNG